MIKIKREEIITMKVKLLILILLVAITSCQKIPQQAIDSPEAKRPITSTSIVSEYMPRKYFGAVLEPESKIIHGAGQDVESFNHYSSLFADEHKPLIYMTYVSISKGSEEVEKWKNKLKKEIDSQVKHNTVLQIGLSFTGGNDKGKGRAEDAANGEFDEAINQIIQSLIELDRPAYLRIGYEFEGSWNGYTPNAYAATFKRIVNKARAQGLQNTAYVWCSGGGSANFIDFDELMKYYPGDEYVDWWGVDIFSPEEITNPWLGKFYALSAKHGKPVMIGETTPRHVGVNDGKKSWDAWYGPFFNMVKQHPEIKAISYINWDWDYWAKFLNFPWHNWKDARIEKNQYINKHYVNELKDPIWLHSQQTMKLEISTLKGE
ncbi:hypothetical protein A3Q33_17680 [Colwellia sp. PAMC 21821]|nr:hypothetical protein A3Q33_17680 [Colwellia sp. PAMC 21821]